MPADGSDLTRADDRVYARSDHVRFREHPCAVSEPGRQSWYVRGQHFVVEYSEVDQGCELERTAEREEHVLLLPDAGTTAEIRAGDNVVRVPGQRLVVMPPGDSTVRVHGSGRVVRLLTSQATDLVDLAINAASYREPRRDLAARGPWPDPYDGWRVRSYDLTVPPLESPRFRLFRCTTFMVNYPAGRTGPRRGVGLSPHTHDDFEQCSLILSGTWVHHLRWPWAGDPQRWREDEHELCEAPSLTVIPAGVLHTSQPVGDGFNHLVDIFAPPRADYSARAGWVFNADEYPTPSI